MIQKNVRDEYFDWMFDLVGGERYRKLLMHLHNREFIYSFRNDVNRAQDGIDLRYRFGHEFLDEPRRVLGEECTMLEMLVALAIRCEETIMDDPAYGDRTAQWFWRMLINLGLGSMLDDRYDKAYVDEAIDRFLNHEYEPDGTGGLFTVKNCEYDLRNVEISFQLFRYLNTLI